MLRYEVDYTRRMFEEGLPLIGRVQRDLALDLDLFSRGGLEILRAIERRDYDVLSARPAITKATKLQLALRALSGKILPFCGLARVRRKERLEPGNSIARRHARSAPTPNAAPSPNAKRRISITPLLRCRSRGAMRSARSTHSCAKPTIFPMMRALRARRRRQRSECMAGRMACGLGWRRNRRSGLHCRARCDGAIQDSAEAAG